MLTDINPFVYSRPIPPEEIIDRDEEVRELLGNAVGGHFVRLYAPRKYGKTSLLRRALRDAEREEGMVCILVDFYGVLSLADVAIRLERGYAHSLKGRVRTRIDDFLKSTGLGLSLTAAGIGMQLQVEPRLDPLPALHALLDLPLRLQPGGGRRALIVFDEFQDVAKVPNIDAIMRSHIQHQGEIASYVFAGSEPTLMRDLFENKARPLYGQAVPMRLSRLQNADLAEFIVDRFRGTDRGVGDALILLLNAAAGHPQRAMLLAYRLWNCVPKGESATLAHWEQAFERALVELTPEFDAQWHGLTIAEQRTLRSLIEGRGSPYRTQVLARLGLAKPTAQEALRNLTARADVETVDGKYALVDPLFALWIERLASGAGAEQ